MDYKEKYEQALERASKICNSDFEPNDKSILCSIIFPELKESEDKQMIERLKSCVYASDLTPEGKEEIFTWLEKQGDDKHTDKVKPKFHEGDWITNGDYIWKIVEVMPLDYILQSQDGNIVDDTIYYVDEHFHLWSIQDAKDGDVLVDEDNNIGLYLEEKDDLYWHSCIYIGCDNYLRGFSIGGYHKHKNTKPATKEQCDTLFAKMKDAGYECDKKELKKIEPKKLDVWNAEDEQNLNVVLSFIPDECLRRWLKDKLCYDTLDADKVIEWLKGTIRETKEYLGEHGEYYDTHLTLPYDSIEDLINDFKEDFGL